MIGRPGEGVGELNWPFSVALAPDGQSPAGFILSGTEVVFTLHPKPRQRFDLATAFERKGIQEHMFMFIQEHI